MQNSLHLPFTDVTLLGWVIVTLSRVYAPSRDIILPDELS